MGAFTYGDLGIGSSDVTYLGTIGWGSSPSGFPQSPSNPFPGVPAGSGGPSNPSGSWLSALLPWASLGAQTFLADQAITSPRPATVTYLPNGQIAASGGGAAAPSFGSTVSSIPTIVWIGLAVLVMIMVFRK